ncbi:MAG: O-antigen ligase family protein [Flavobacteriales bacterium]
MNLALLNAAPFRAIHVVALVLCAVFLPWSTAFLSMAQMLLVLNWLVEGAVRGDLRARFRKGFLSAPSAVFLSFLGLHMLGLLWTEDLHWGTGLVRILLPLLTFGVVLAGSPALGRREFRTVMLFGAWSAVTSALFCALFSGAGPGDYRSLSMFISHIRLVLLLCLAIVVFVWDLRQAARWERVAELLAMAWCLYFINRLGSIQGYFILLLICGVMIWRRSMRLHPVLCWSLRTGMVVLPLMVLLPLVRELRARTAPPPQDLHARFPRSAGGEPYTHDLRDPQQVNGHYVWTHIAWNELRRTWLQRSERSLDTPDDRGHPMWSTAVRYMASKGLTKDSVGVMALSEADVRAIEHGVPDHLEGQRSVLRERLEEVLFELQVYGDKGLASGHSVAMRLEFWRTGLAIARDHWVLGVGTGDTQRAFDAQYIAMGSDLAPEWRLRAHNEYLTLLISFGALGLLWSLFSWWWPAWRMGAWRDPLFIGWAVVFGISCLTDDTIETQAGATVFALYYTLLVFASPRNGVTPPAVPAPAAV